VTPRRYTRPGGVTPPKRDMCNAPVTGAGTRAAEDQLEQDNPERYTLLPRSVTSLPRGPLHGTPSLEGAGVTPGGGRGTGKARKDRNSTNGVLPADLVEELGRVLGEALAQQYKCDAERMVTTPGATNHGK